MAKKSSLDKKPVQKKKIRFHYIKSSQFRVVYADGAWGGVSPPGLIHIAFYNDRNPIPQQIVHEISETGLGTEIKGERVTRSGIVREVEVDVAMNLNTAKSLYKWLEDKIKDAEKLQILSRKKKK